MTTTNSYLDEFTTLAQIFSDAWVEGSPAEPITAVAYPNLPFNPPVDESGHKLPFVRFFVMNGESQQISIGNVGSNVFRHTGILSAKIYTPKGMGETQALELADKFIDIFRNLTIDRIVFKAPYVKRIGETDEGYYQINGFCPFRRDSYL